MAESKKKWITGLTKFDPDTKALEAWAYPFQLDRDGETILPTAFNVENYTKNPVVQWAHDYYSPPIGRAENIRVDDKGLRFSPVFAPTKAAQEIKILYEEGFLNAFSIGFISHGHTDEHVMPGQTGLTHTAVELLEISAVPVPSNPGALLIRALESPGEDTPLLVSRAFMAGLSKDLAEWNAMKAASAAAVAEPEQKEGRVLSAKNRALVSECVGKMGEAGKALQALLDATEPEKMVSIDPDEKASMEVQSLVLSKKVFEIAKDARKWVTEHDFKDNGYDETEESWRFRQFAPGQCQENSTRSKEIADGVIAVLCKRGEEGICELDTKMIHDARAVMALTVESIRARIERTDKLLDAVRCGVETIINTTPSD